MKGEEVLKEASIVAKKMFNKRTRDYLLSLESKIPDEDVELFAILLSQQIAKQMEELESK